MAVFTFSGRSGCNVRAIYLIAVAFLAVASAVAMLFTLPALYSWHMVPFDGVPHMVQRAVSEKAVRFEPTEHPAVRLLW